MSLIAEKEARKILQCESLEVEQRLLPLLIEALDKVWNEGFDDGLLKARLDRMGNATVLPTRSNV